MEDSDTKPCPNCKREIPAVNFTIHSVHCARNIRVCPVCKEPVPQSELQEHHEKLHKLLPCKKCGESVCGTDLEDHIRDSCAHTIKSCRFCELELPRREIPGHESYCGVRTEQCPECREWVMIKYRQLHLDSNHGFIRLDDDPAPISKKEPFKPINLARPLVPRNLNLPSTSNGVRPSTSSSRPAMNGLKNINLQAPRTEMRYFSSTGTSSSGSSNGECSSDWTSTNNVKPPFKRTNDQPQINTTVPNTNKVDKNLSISRGAVKKRPAPKPPVKTPPASPRRDLPYYSALQRQQKEENDRREQTAINLSVGLPPVLSAAAKLEKLRKMDALQNPETRNDEDYKNKLQGRVWHNPMDPAGQALGSSSDRRQDFKNLKPMTPQEFMERFNELQLRKDEEGEVRRGDRFSEIKSSLRELRRGLNEVTAPYNSNSNINVPSSNSNISNNGNDRHSRPSSPVGDEVRLPCEFCGAPVLVHDLVQHQTGCRPDLAQVRPRSVTPPTTSVVEDPVIPCEFCTRSLPVYLISEHQERCGRETQLLYPD